MEILFHLYLAVVDHWSLC